jgi:hypothetical protein
MKSSGQVRKDLFAFGPTLSRYIAFLPPLDVVTLLLLQCRSSFSYELAESSDTPHHPTVPSG